MDKKRVFCQIYSANLMLISLASQQDPLPASLPCFILLWVFHVVSATWLGPFDEIQTKAGFFFILDLGKTGRARLNLGSRKRYQRCRDSVGPCMATTLPPTKNSEGFKMFFFSTRMHL